MPLVSSDPPGLVPGRPPRDPLPVAGLTVLAVAVFAAITTEVLPVGLLPVMAADLSTTESRIGLLVSAYAVVVAIGSLPLAALLSRWPKKPVLAALLCGYALSNAVVIGTDQYWVAFGARLFGGLVHAGFFSVVFAAAAGIAPPGRAGRAIAVVSGGVVVALALGVPLGTAVGTAFGWRWAFAGSTAMILALAAAITLVFPTVGRPTRAAGGSVLAAARRGPLLGVAAITVVATMGNNTLYTYIGPLLGAAGIPAGGVAPVLFGYGAAGVLGLVVAGALVDRRPHRTLQVTVAGTAGCLLALGLLAHSPTGTVLATVLWGGTFGALPVLLQSAALAAAPDNPDAAPAVVNATFNVGIAGGSFLGARELLVAPASTLAFTAAALVAGALVLVSLRVGQRGAGPPRPATTPTR